MNKNKATYILCLLGVYTLITLIYAILLSVQFSLLGFACSFIFKITCYYSRLWFGSAVIALAVVLLYLYPVTKYEVKEQIIKYLNKE